MASPFDFSSFLLTPPIPGHSTTASGQLQQNSANGTGQEDGANQGGNLSTSLQNQQYSLSQSMNSYNGAGNSNGQQQQGQQQQQDGSTQPQQQGLQQHDTGQNGSNSNGNEHATTSKLATFDERDYGLDPSAFSTVNFQMPSFLTASSAGQFGEGGPAVVDPSAFHNPPPSSTYQPQYNFDTPATYQTSSLLGGNLQRQQPQQQNGTQQQKQTYVPDTSNPVYGIYGSSVISVNPDPSPFKLQLNNAQPTFNPTQESHSRGNTPDFDPKSLGLPVGNSLFPQPLPGLYSSSGFDMLGVLARVVARPNPQINIGPVDTSCSFLVVDARRYDMPIVFASSTFTELTGYTNSEIIGRNCRFLQAPDGHVAMGSRRKYTDGNAVYHLKSHIQSGKETQASIINYRKDGSPFINLVTVIPISWDTDEIAYFVGFQVDLVEQPNAILEKMRNGTYVVNYSLLPQQAPPQMPPANTMSAASEMKQEPVPLDDSLYSEQKPVKVVNPVASGAATQAAAQSSMAIAPELLEVMGLVDNDMDDETAKKKWNKMLLDHTGDFVHVLSLKGSFLYVSPSVKPMLEYDSSDLIGRTLQSVCHPSDIVPVMRELKEASTVSHPIINLLYRFRRKNSGYVWMEAHGKLYLEQSKSRKCVILVGRERPVYKLSWKDLNAAGGLGEKEFWSKVSPDGMFLYNTPTIQAVLGHTVDDLQGTSIFELCETEQATKLTKALQEASAGGSVRLRHKLRNKKGNQIDVITNFYPNSKRTDVPPRQAAGVVHPSIIAQTNEYTSEMRRRATAPSATSSLPLPQGVQSPGQELSSRPSNIRTNSAMIRDMIVSTPDPPSDRESSDGQNPSPSVSGSDSSAPSTFSAIPSTYKSIIQNKGAQSDNIFDELDTTRTTSWQYELHQLKLTNRKLKEELHMLQAAKRKRKKQADQAGQNTLPGSSNSSVGQGAAGKTCANCGKTDSPEWRVGPTGQRNLCNACGLRWAKANRLHRQNSGTPGSSSSGSGSGGGNGNRSGSNAGSGGNSDSDAMTGTMASVRNNNNAGAGYQNFAIPSGPFAPMQMHNQQHQQMQQQQPHPHQQQQPQHQNQQNQHPLHRPQLQHAESSRFNP